MSNNNDTEIEVKFFLANPAYLEKKLKSLGAVMDSPRTLERNLRFDTEDGALYKTQRVLRLRMDSIARLTYKGPGEVQEGARLRRELEVSVSDFDTTWALLESLGYVVVVMYEKYRTTFAYNGTSVTLDEMPYGKFCEVEGPDGKTIQLVSSQLGLKWEKRILDSYLALFDRARASQGFTFKDLSFENFRGVDISPQAMGIEPGDYNAEHCVLNVDMKSFQNLTGRGRARRLRCLALNALKFYDLDVDRIGLVTNNLNGIFRVNTVKGDKWILRVTQPQDGHTYDHAAAEIDFLTALARDTHLSVPRPLAARDGRWVVEASAEGVPEARLCEVFRWVPGIDLAKCLTPGNMLLLGQLSAQLHQYARSYQPPAGLELLAFDRVFPFPEPVILFEKGFESLFTPAQRDLFQQGVEQAQTAIHRLKASGEPMRILHGDLHQWNVRYSRGVLSPIDFEDLMWGWPVQDIAITLYYSIDRPDFLELRTAFEQGYRGVNSWPERYNGEIEAFIAARGIGLLNFVLQNHALLDVTPADFAVRIENRLHVLMGIHHTGAV